jgi:RND family efflux transporter MFP subunit
MNTLRFMVLVVMGLIVGCKQQPADKPRSNESAGFKVIKPAPLERVIEQPARVMADKQTPLVAGVAGWVLELGCDIGTPVKGPRRDSKGDVIEPGDLLALLWAPEVEVELKQKDALVKQAQAEKKFAEESVKAKEAEQSRMLSQWQRLSKLGQTVSPDDIEESRLAYQVAKAKWSMAKEEVGVKTARVEVANEDRNRVKTKLDYAQIRAPFDGVVTVRNVDVGHYLEPGTNSLPLFVVARTDHVRIVSEIPEVDAPLIHDKMKATIRVQGLEDLEGRVTRTSRVLSAKGRTLRIEIDLPSKGILVPGTYAYVSLTARPANRLTLPAAAIADLDDQPYCFLLSDGKAVKTPVQIGMRNGERIEVRRKQVSGDGGPQWVALSPTDEVILGNLSALSDGQPVPNLKEP